MYESFFGFKEKPFNITPDPRFLYNSKTHREALAQLILGVQERKGFAVLSGEVGTGKTTIVRALLERLDENCQVAYVFNTKLPVTDFLRYVCRDFGLQSNGDAKIDYLIKLHDFLIESHNDGRTTVLIVDEAQSLDASLFEEIRMLTNLETSSQKLLQIFLVGQPELDDLLDQSELWQLKQRISNRYHLLPLDRQETKEYIYTRMRIAGARRLNCFSDGAIQKIYEHSQGIPRLINNICDNSLLIGYATDAPVINEKIVRECVADLQLEKPPKSLRQLRKRNGESPRRHGFAYASLIVILIGFLAAGIALFVFGKTVVPQTLWKGFEAIDSLFQKKGETEATETSLFQQERTEGEKEISDSLFQSKADLSARSDIAETTPVTDFQRGVAEEGIKTEAPQTAGLAESLGFRIVIAREGDNISQIIFREYGRVDEHLLSIVQELNPEIEDINEIEVGQKVRLPWNPKEAYKNPGAPPYFSVHIASFKRFDKAKELFNELIDIGEKPTIIPTNIKGSAWYRVTIGECKSFGEASFNARRIVESGRFIYAKPIEVSEVKQARTDKSAVD